MFLISFVAYQKFTEYSNLKSIDSYDSCVAAEGSIIQESYPSTCITRIGIRFTQPLNRFSTEGWITYTSKICGYRIQYPQGWSGSSVVKGYGLDKISDEEDNITLRSTESGAMPLIKIACNLISWPNLDTEAANSLNKTNIVLTNETVDDIPARSLSAKILQGDHQSFSKTYILFIPNNKNAYKIYYQDDIQRSNGLLIDQILSTFHFLD
jgi:hypothetical protein